MDQIETPVSALKTQLSPDSSKATIPNFLSQEKPIESLSPESNTHQTKISLQQTAQTPNQTNIAQDFDLEFDENSPKDSSTKQPSGIFQRSKTQGTIITQNTKKIEDLEISQLSPSKNSKESWFDVAPVLTVEQQILDQDYFIKQEEWFNCVDSTQLNVTIVKYKKQLIGENFYIVETKVSKGGFIVPQNSGYSLDDLDKDFVMAVESMVSFRQFNFFHTQVSVFGF